MSFVCEKCRDGEHCGRDRNDTWCDCQHRGPIKPEPPR